MASPVYTVETALAVVKLGRNDAGGDWLTDAQYRSLIAANIVEPRAALTFDKLVTGYYVYNYGQHGGRYTILLFEDDTTPFAGEDDVEYEVSARGSIVVTTGTHSTNSISVTAAVIDYGKLMEDIYFTLSAQSSITIAQSFGNIGITPGVIARDLREIASHWRGVR